MGQRAATAPLNTSWLVQIKAEARSIALPSSPSYGAVMQSRSYPSLCPCGSTTLTSIALMPDLRPLIFLGLSTRHQQSGGRKAQLCCVSCLHSEQQYGTDWFQEPKRSKLMGPLIDSSGVVAECKTKISTVASAAADWPAWESFNAAITDQESDMLL
jgi:hypothetical protein